MYVTEVCFKCFIRMLQVFHLDVACVLQWLHTCFTSVFRCLQVFSCSEYMLQVFHLNVAKVNLVLHMQRDSSVATAGASCMRVGSDGGWRQGHKRSWAHETGATRASCMRQAQEAEGDGGRGARPHVHAVAGSRGGVRCPNGRRRGSHVRVDVREMEQQAPASHTLLQLILFFFLKLPFGTHSIS
jgi:hypothetical protein